MGREVQEEPPFSEERPVYGCVGGDRPEADPYIDEVDGVLYYTCPECRKELEEELGSLPTEGGIGHASAAPEPSETSA